MNKTEQPRKMSFAPLMEKYFLSFMITQRKVSPRTISTYRDSIRLYLGYLDSVHQVKPDTVEMEHFSLDYLSAFTEYLRQQRKCSASTINLRIAAIKSFLKYAAVEAPEYSGIIRKSLTVPAQKSEKPVMTFIDKNEYEAMLMVSNGSDILSLRDKMMLMILYNTGCRVSELINIHTQDVVIAHEGTSSIRFMGKGRKERVTPIWKTTAAFIGDYIKLQNLVDNDKLFQCRNKAPLTRSGVAQRITVISAKAEESALSLKEKRVTPHTFRHSAAMNLLQAGVDISTIAIWLGHESIETTHRYMVADIELKRKAMEKLEETADISFNYQPSFSILSFLESL